MSNDFWARKIAGVQPAQPQQQAPAQGSHAWWRLGQPATPTVPAVQPETVAQQDELAGHDISKATHLKTEGVCPECQGGNYGPTGKVTGQNGTVVAYRCFDCGYPVNHSTRGLGGLSRGQADGAARQIATGGLVNNYQPQNPIAGAIRTAADLRS